jgi:hypothetical protein
MKAPTNSYEALVLALELAVGKPLVSTILGACQFNTSKVASYCDTLLCA